jgi:hypothetical protein
MSGFIGSILFLLCFALNAKASIGSEPKKDSTGKGPVFLSLGFDLSRIFLSTVRTGFQAGELSVDFRKKGWLAGSHVGFASQEKTFETYLARTQGFYGSLGLARSLFQEEENVLAFGLGLAGSSFSYQPRSVQLVRFPEEGTDRMDLPAKKGSFLWMELTSSIRTRLYGWIMMGFDIRLKGKLKGPKEDLSPYFIPGYGLAGNSFNPGFNYYIFVQIPKGKPRVGKTH